MNKSRSDALMILGFMLTTVGLIAVLVGWTSDISVSSPIGDVTNLQKMQNQSITISIGLVMIVIGIGLFVTGVLTTPSSSNLPCPYCGSGVKNGYLKCSGCRSEIAWIDGQPIKPEDNNLQLNELRDAAYKLFQQKYKEGKYDEALRSIHHYTTVLKSQNRNDPKLEQAIPKCKAMAAQSAFRDMKQLVAKSMYREALVRVGAHKNEILKDSAISPEFKMLSFKCEKKIQEKEKKSIIIGGSVILVLFATLIGMAFFFERQAKIKEEKLLAEQKEKKRESQAERNRILQSPLVSNSINMLLKQIPPSEFIMGPKYDNHKVILTKPYYIGVHEVTQEQYEAVVGANPSYNKGSRNPVESVSWFDAVAFCRELSELPAEKSAGRVYRLPTEAEWECACRADTTTDYFFGDDATQLGLYSWFAANSEDRTHAVSEKSANPWGLHDMYGNVQEWCWDWHEENLPEEITSDPQGPSTGIKKIIRGSLYFCEHPSIIKSSYRGAESAEKKNHWSGFRVVMTYSHERP
jgi:formylglycine-generating enzyme required for sulfatase activity